MTLITKTAVALLGKKKGIRISTKVYETLEKKVEEMIDNAVDRAKGNNRKTLMPSDL